MSHIDLKKMNNQDLAALGHRVLTELSTRAMTGNANEALDQHDSSIVQPEVELNAPMAASSHHVWAIYNDLSRGHPKWWFSKGIPPKMALN